MVNSFIRNRYYGLLMTPTTIAHTGAKINFVKATGFNPNVDEVDNGYSYIGSNEAYSKANIVSMELMSATTVRFADNNGDYFDCSNKFAICFIYDTNTGDTSDIRAEAFLIESALMIYSELDQQWVKVPHLASGGYSGTATTAVDSSRNAKARVIASVVRSDIAKAECKWNYLTTKQYSDLAKLFEPKYGGSFFVKACFFDSVAGGFDCSREFYCGDRKVTFARIKCDDNYMPIGYESVGLNLIER